MIAINPNDPDVIYQGTAGGGIWRTIDGGAQWTPIFDRQVSLGVFSQADWSVAPRVELSAGLRYQSDLQTRTGVLGIGRGNPLLLDYRERHSRLLPKLTASYDLGAGVRVGAQIQRAFNPGGVTLDALRGRPVCWTILPLGAQPP